ncbi:hypothetical protein Btru_074852 [Bulinus truncatus]|nr:hypothetical protein Btru_074852 [Bulinus truncatus]
MFTNNYTYRRILQDISVPEYKWLFRLKWNVARMDWISILAFVATVTSFTNQFVGIEICFHIVRKGNTGDISPVPFIAFFVSAAIWFKYGLMMKITNVILTSGLGTLLQFLYICFYYVYCTKKTQFYGFFIIGTIILFIPLLYVTFFEEEINVATQNIGLYCAGVGILCYASPLATLSKVIKQKSTSSISFPLCFVNFLCAVEWSLYGAAIEDYVLLIPNFLGIFLGLAQFYLFWIYGCKINKLAWMTETK